METTLQNAHQNMWMETRLLLHAWCTVEISILNSTCVWSKLKRHPWKIVLCWYRRKKNNPLFLEVKTSFKCIKVPFIRRWPFYLSLWQKMVHTNKQASALTDGFEERRITHGLMRWKKSDPIFQKSLAVSCQKYFIFSCLEFRQLRKISCLSWCLFISVDGKRHALCFEVAVCCLCSMVLACHTRHVGHFGSWRKRWRSRVSSTFTLVPFSVYIIDSDTVRDIFLQNGFPVDLWGETNKRWKGN